MNNKNIEEVKAEKYYPDGGYGWIILAAIVLINLSISTLVQCFGLIFHDEFLKWDVKLAQTSFLLHLQNSLFCIISFMSSPFLKKYNFRPVALIGAFLVNLGIFLSSFAMSYLELIFTVSILVGIGQGILMPATYLATYSYFNKKLTIATSISVTGAGLTPILMAKVCAVLLNRIGRKYTVLVLSGMSLFSFVGCLLLKPVEQKDQADNDMKEMEEINKSKKLKESEEVVDVLLEPQHPSFDISQNLPQKRSIYGKLFDAFDLHLLQNTSFIIIVIGLGISFAAELNIILTIQFLLQELSLFDSNEVAYAVSFQSLFDILGRLIIPMFGHLCNAESKFMYIGALLIAGIGRTILAMWSQQKLAILASLLLIGLTKGCRAVYQSLIIPAYIPLEKIPAANGINMLFTGTLSLILGPIIGAVHDFTQSYIYSLHTATLLSLICVILWLPKFSCEKRQENNDSIN